MRKTEEIFINPGLASPGKLQLRCEPFQLIQAGRHLLREGELHNVNNWEVAFLIILKDLFLVCRLLSLVVPSL